MTEYGALSELGRRTKNQSSMPLLNEPIRFALAGIGTPPYPDKFTSSLQSPKVVVVIALI
jgi:hypothetical protein